MVRWNQRFPLDNLYRRKYGMGFGSLAHRELSPISIYFEFQEELDIIKIRTEVLDEQRKSFELSRGFVMKAQSKKEVEEALNEEMKEIDEELGL